MTPEEKEIDEAYGLFHKLWGYSKDKIYSKKDWAELQYLLSKIIQVKPFKN